MVGSNLLYLDPHELQPAGPLPECLPSYFCQAVRLMPTAAIDPSLAIGFYCRTMGLALLLSCLDLAAEEFEDLAQRLAALAEEHRAAPIVTVAAPGTATAVPTASMRWTPSDDEEDEDDNEGMSCGGEAGDPCLLGIMSEDADDSPQLLSRPPSLVPRERLPSDEAPAPEAGRAPEFDSATHAVSIPAGKTGLADCACSPGGALGSWQACGRRSQKRLAAAGQVEDWEML
ncbi:cysteine protease [Haematococcus lacustris]|uniref:Cysteine protease n=1 Tax=Haematococcus lacustris TaxID=44745 RepID=A0A699Z9C4_HAELA|nr:cysteine protease [Haematococcus lacustris]